MITPAQRAEIRRLFYGEHWKVGTIAAQLGLHRETVRAAVERETAGVRPSLCRPSILDPYLPFIRDTLAQYPRLRATRIHEMVRQRGYAGSVFPVRRLVRRLRPESGRAVYRRVVTLVGEQAQVDWGSFGKVHIGQGTRTVSGFVMVLGYSRALAALFTLDQTLESFLRGHVDAFEALGGAARNLVYDNLRSAVLDRRGAAVQFHPRLLDLAGHYHFAPRPCTPGRGNEKGKVERQIQYLRHAFFAARPFRDLDDINAQFRRWRDEVAHRRRHPDQPDRTVADVWAEEKPRLLPLPAHPFETDLVRVVRSGKTPYVRFDRNLYSIPHTHVRKPLTLVAGATRIRILDGQTELTNHHRTYDTGLTVEDPAHLENLLAATRQANAHTTRDRLRAAVPATATLFERLAERGEALRPNATRLLALRSQAIHYDNSRFSPRHLKSGHYLLRRVVRCRVCDLTMSCHRMRGRNGAFHHYYYCHGHDLLMARRAIGCCPQRNLRSDELDALVWGEVRRHLENPTLIREGYARLQTQAGSPGDDGLADELAALEKQLAELDREEHRLLDAYQAGLVDIDQLRQRQGRLRQRRAHVNGSIEVLHTERKTAQQQAQLQADLETFVDRIRGTLATLDFDARQQLVRTVLERVMVEDGRVDIHFAIPLPEPPPDTTNPCSGLGAPCASRFRLRSRPATWCRTFPSGGSAAWRSVGTALRLRACSRSRWFCLPGRVRRAR